MAKNKRKKLLNTKKWEKIEKQLQVGDVLLFHTRPGDPIADKVKKDSHSYWNHTALVFVDSSQIPYGRPLIVEAVTYGIEVHQIRRYADRPERYDIGVLRYKGLTKKQRQHLVDSFVLNNIDTPYDFSRFVGLYLQKVAKILPKRMYRAIVNKLVNPNNYLCSTFIHRAFRFMEGKDLREYDREIAQEGVNEVSKYHWYTPGDLAKDENLEWIYNKHD